MFRFAFAMLAFVVLADQAMAQCALCNRSAANSRVQYLNMAFVQAPQAAAPVPMSGCSGSVSVQVMAAPRAGCAGSRAAPAANAGCSGARAGLFSGGGCSGLFAGLRERRAARRAGSATVQVNVVAAPLAAARCDAVAADAWAMARVVEVPVVMLAAQDCPNGMCPIR